MTRTAVYKIEVMVIDHDQLGPDNTKQAFENARFPNDCLDLHVIALDARDVDWTDEHPLNKRDWRDAFERLFGSHASVATIVHVVRNALVPARYQLQEAMTTPREDRYRRIEVALIGIETVLGFVDDIAT